jgi:type IV secretion system protein TrbL
MLGTINNPNFFTAMLAVLISGLCAIGVVVAFAVVAGQLMITLIESYIVISAGIFFLGFSGSRWTLPFSEKYVAYAISVGIKLFMLYLIVGLGQTLASQWSALFTPGVIAAPDIYIGVAGSALIFMLLGWQIPSLAASLMNGSPLMTLGTAASTLSTTVAGGAAVVGGTLAAVGAVGAAGFAGAASLVGDAANLKKLEGGRPSTSTDGVGLITGEPRGTSQVTNTTRSSKSSQASGPSVGSASTALGNLGETAGVASGDPRKTSANPSEVTRSQPDDGTSQTQSSANSDTGAPLVQEVEPSQSVSKPPASQDQPSSTPARSRTRPSILDILRNVRPPTFPNDAGSGSIHIRFKHHDSE